MFENSGKSTRSKAVPGLNKVFDGDKCRLSVVGELKQEHANILYEEAVNAFDIGARHLIVDFSETDYADTIGLQNLVLIFKHVSTNPDLKLEVYVPEGELMEILRTCRFDKFIDIHNDEAVLSGNWQPG